MPHIGRALTISSVGALTGWGTGMLYCCSAMLLPAHFHLWYVPLEFDQAFFLISFVTGAVMAAVVFCVWLLALLPFAFFVPSRSLFWKKSILTPIGLLSGFAVGAAVLVCNAVLWIRDWPAEMYDWQINFINNFRYFWPASALGGLFAGLACAVCHQRLTPARINQGQLKQRPDDPRAVMTEQSS